MSISVHFTPGTLKKLKPGLQKHQERFNQKEGEIVNKTTNSYIDSTQTKGNRLLYRNPELSNYNNSVKAKLSSQFKELNSKLQANGRRAKRSNANLWMAGTLQLSKDTLDRLGYQEGKKWDEQREEVQKVVWASYTHLIHGMVDRKEYYGVIETATLHVDESIPHVDFISTGIDLDDLDYSIGTVLNGRGKKYKKGQKLKEIQDELENIALEKFGKNLVEKYDFHRGEPASKTKTLKSSLNERERRISEREENVRLREDKLEKRLKKQSETFKQREEELSKREKNVDALYSHFNELLESRKQELHELADRQLDNHDLNTIEYIKLHDHKLYFEMSNKANVFINDLVEQDNSITDDMLMEFAKQHSYKDYSYTDDGQFEF